MHFYQIPILQSQEYTQFKYFYLSEDAGFLFLFFIWWKYWYILNLICILLNHTLLLQNSGNLVIKFRLLSPTRKVNLSSRNMSGFSNYPLKPVKGCSQTRPNPSRVLKQSKTHSTLNMLFPQLFPQYLTESFSSWECINQNLSYCAS